MSQEFLARILEQKAREVEQMKLEQIQPLRQTYRLAEFLKNHQDCLQVIAGVKKASPTRIPPINWLNKSSMLLKLLKLLFIFFTSFCLLSYDY
ncbi:hypothetical protein K8353_42900 [Burkholderia contaminans]|nr:hypothetical protein [Burkholderia contaminans]